MTSDVRLLPALGRGLTGLARTGWLIAPVIVAGLGHVVVLKTGRLRVLAVPIDGGAHWRGRPIFGAHKTWRGVIVMVGLTALAMAAQATIARRSTRIAAITTVDFDRINPWLAGACYGLGYCLGELPNSFVKRQLGIAPGRRSQSLGNWQYLADQADSVIGCLVALRTFHHLRVAEAATAAGLGLLVHIGVDQLMYRAGIKQRAS